MKPSKSSQTSIPKQGTGLQWHSQAPANTIILGEHSVVYGHPALACALDQWIHIDWQARSDKRICITSALANFQTDIETLETHPELQFVIKALQAFQTELAFGLNITIHSEFSSTIGLGSSAAVLAAMLDGLNTLTQKNFPPLALFEIGLAIIIEIQGRGSGTDLAASLTGGILYFEPSTHHSKQSKQKHPKLTSLPLTLPLCLFYAGYKTPTSEVLEFVAQQWQTRPKALNALYQSMGETTQRAFNLLQTLVQLTQTSKTTPDLIQPESSLTKTSARGGEIFSMFYQSLHTYQHLMETLGVSDPILQQLIQYLNQCPNIHAAKISGSGLGDCVLGIGSLKNCPPTAQHFLQNYQQLSIHITPNGASTTIK